jgi:hypothetical protein
MAGRVLLVFWKATRQGLTIRGCWVAAGLTDATTTTSLRVMK